MIPLSVLIQYQCVTDGQPHCDSDSRAMLRVARAKNDKAMTASEIITCTVTAALPLCVLWKSQTGHQKYDQLAEESEIYQLFLPVHCSWSPTNSCTFLLVTTIITFNGQWSRTASVSWYWNDKPFRVLLQQQMTAVIVVTAGTVKYVPTICA